MEEIVLARNVQGKTFLSRAVASISSTDIKYLLKSDIWNSFVKKLISMADADKFTVFHSAASNSQHPDVLPTLLEFVIKECDFSLKG